MSGGLLSLGRRLWWRGAGCSWGLGARGPPRAPAQLLLQVQHVAVALRVVRRLGLHELMEAAKVVHLPGWRAAPTVGGVLAHQTPPQTRACRAVLSPKPPAPWGRGRAPQPLALGPKLKLRPEDHGLKHCPSPPVLRSKFTACLLVEEFSGGPRGGGRKGNMRQDSRECC